jgi:hypothetical protein
MTTSTQATLRHALRRAAVRATLAPSVHNTQPWRFVIGDGYLELHADPSRQLRVLDPTRRQLLMSCGCALFNARVSLAALGYPVDVERMPDPAQPNLLARLAIGNGAEPESEAFAALDSVIELRRTNRRRYADDDVPDEVVSDLLTDAADEEAVLVPVTDPAHRVMTAVLSQRADSAQNADPAYRAELRAWTSDGVDRDDGVPSEAIPHSGGLDAQDDIPIRDFDTRGTGRLPGRTRSGMAQCLLLLGSYEDNAAAWLRSGEALERVLLDVTRHGFVASVLSQVIEVPATRAMLRENLNLSIHPHMLVRVGRAADTPATRRRRLVDVLSETP